MTNLRMGDGPVRHLPDGLDVYAGYTNDSGIGATFPLIVAAFPNAKHLSITTNGSPARVADVEPGAMSSWARYEIGYTSVSNVGAQILKDGRPSLLWVAHYTNIAHICTSARCWPSSPVPWVADGSQWTTHGNTWDESLLSPAFFPAPAPAPTPTDGDDAMRLLDCTGKATQWWTGSKLVPLTGTPTVTPLQQVEAVELFMAGDQLTAAQYQIINGFLA